jgi:PIN domain nuclease of toxin-antitoxin system
MPPCLTTSARHLEDEGSSRTHTLLWWALDDTRLSASALSAIRHADTSLFVSVVSLWEIVIKAKLEKLPLPGEPAAILAKAEEQACTILPVLATHALGVYTLPDIADHRDPFDRLLVAQRFIEGLTLVTADARLAEYGVKVLW